MKKFIIDEKEVSELEFQTALNEWIADHCYAPYLSSETTDNLSDLFYSSIMRVLKDGGTVKLGESPVFEIVISK